MDNNDEKTMDREESGLVNTTKGKHPIHCLTIIGQIEGHFESNTQMKTTKYEHVIPQLVSVQEDPDIEALLVILNTVGGDVEAGLAIAELIRGMTKPTASIVLGGGHSIGIPLAVSADRSFIAPTATMTIHPVRHSGTVLATGQTMNYLESIQQRVTDFVCENSGISRERFSQLMTQTDNLIMDLGTCVDGKTAVKEGIIDAVGTIGDVLEFLYSEIEKG
ncbi:MAG: ATP-dependent Clp protease proteolytic subunit [Oscillospiraceae bacterium]|nr:ATP-dependent Clp protease proteolytic subunit [Oscillospiraceae bacterium]MBP1571485.1 ATP-dependent Clp protease proteolytic subunit [Oscillospiraceae bacterium]MBQ5324497.1 ATP-dependent Clp protease proteolytic subunit [Oscillospiraceae bacterium]